MIKCIYNNYKKAMAFRHCFFVVFFLFFTFIPMFPMQYWGEGVFFDFGFSSKESVPKPIPLEGTIGLRKSFSYTDLFTAFCIDNFAFDACANGSFCPIRKNIFSFHVQYLTHISKSFGIEDFPNLFVWDNLFAISTKFISKDKENPFETVIDLGINIKRSRQKLSEDILVLTEVFPIIKLQFSKRFLSKHEILFRLSTFDPLYFRGFLNSWWQIGYAYDICDKITSGILLDVMYVDQFTLSGMISGFQGKLFVVYKF
ncbi:MAG: hypothetical protein IJ312_06555 [Treponema sp.]|nr:hypothetical protein [Treponema sp.]